MRDVRFERDRSPSRTPGTSERNRVCLSPDRTPSNAEGTITGILEERNSKKRKHGGKASHAAGDVVADAVLSRENGGVHGVTHQTQLSRGNNLDDGSVGKSWYRVQSDTHIAGHYSGWRSLSLFMLVGEEALGNPNSRTDSDEDSVRPKVVSFCLSIWKTWTGVSVLNPIRYLTYPAIPIRASVASAAAAAATGEQRITGAIPSSNARTANVITTEP